MKRIIDKVMEVVPVIITGMLIVCITLGIHFLIQQVTTVPMATESSVCIAEVIKINTETSYSGGYVVNNIAVGGSAHTYTSSVVVRYPDQSTETITNGFWGFSEQLSESLYEGCFVDIQDGKIIKIHEDTGSEAD